MFLNLFYGLREEGVPVSIQEWQMFMTALEKGLHRCELLRFYDLAKSCLIKVKLTSMRLIASSLTSSKVLIRNCHRVMNSWTGSTTQRTSKA